MTLFYSGSDSRNGERSDVTLWQDEAGELVPRSSIGLVSPSWVVAHPSLPILYATQETEPGAVVVIAIGETGALQVRQRVDSNGSLPCHLALDPDATQLAASNYLDGVVSVWRLTADGAIAEVRGVWRLSGRGPVARRQERSHAHASCYRDGALLIVDLGGDSLELLGADGVMQSALRLKSGFGPRHLVPIGRDRVVLVGELSSELALIDLSDAGARVVDVVPTTDSSGGQPSGITARGDAVIVANRGVGSIAEFGVVDDRLVPLAEIRLPGDQPRAIGSDGRRVFVCVQDAGLVAVYPSSGIQNRPHVTPALWVSDFGIIPSDVAAGITT
jgi:6-phosphogluconolactonase